MTQNMTRNFRNGLTVRLVGVGPTGLETVGKKPQNPLI